jgi:hypothetical protein
MSQNKSYFIVILDEKDNRLVYEFTSEVNCKMFIIYEINEWDGSINESDIDPDLVEFYMNLSLEKLISKAKNYYSINIEKCIIGNEILT